MARVWMSSLGLFGYGLGRNRYCYDWLSSPGLTNGHAKEVKVKGLRVRLGLAPRDLQETKWSHCRSAVYRSEIRVAEQ
jgi:hypothetical protein